MGHTFSTLLLRRLVLTLEYGAVRGLRSGNSIQALDLDTCAARFSAACTTLKNVVVRISHASPTTALDELFLDAQVAEEDEREVADLDPSDEEEECEIEGDLATFMADEEEEGW